MKWDEVSGVGLRTMAPEAFAAFDMVAVTVVGAADPVLVDLARLHIAGLLRATDPELIPGNALSEDKLVALASWPAAAGLSETERVCVGLAEQFALDVGATTDAQRTKANEALGAGAFAFVQVLYALDAGLRVREAIRQVFGVEITTTVGATGEGAGLWPALEAWMSAVARMDTLDPLTTELVRLRGARTHNCRVCKSRRNVRAVKQGQGEATFDQIDDYESSDLSERHKVALRLTDAMTWQPAAHPAELNQQLRANLAADEVLEIVFDVARNAANKIAVALGADQANVVGGVEYFDTDQDGELILGLAPYPRGA